MLAWVVAFFGAELICTNARERERISLLQYVVLKQKFVIFKYVLEIFH
jgi:hypothetical protein